MRALLLTFAFASGLRTTSALAQPEAPSSAEASGQPAASAAEEAEGSAPTTGGPARPAGDPEAPVATEGSTSAARASSSSPADAEEQGRASSPPTAPPPAPPTAADGATADPSADPGAAEPAHEPPLRNVDLGADFGTIWRPASGDTGITYSPSIAWGAHARIEMLSWLGVRALVLSALHPVTVERGALGPSDDTEVDQPSLRIILLAAQVEPTLVITPRFRLFAGLGCGWATVTAPAPESRGDPEYRSARRDGVLIDLTAALGATVEPILDWMTVSATVSGGLTVAQSGEVSDPDGVQAFEQDPDAESIDHYAALPEFAGSLGALVSVGMIL
jgi:hypothetical protein